MAKIRKNIVLNTTNGSAIVPSTICGSATCYMLGWNKQTDRLTDDTNA